MLSIIFLKLLGIVLAIAVVADLVLFVMNIIQEFAFWIVLAVAGVFAYVILPKMKKKADEKGNA